MKHVELFTDGACSGNPGPGGWGALLRYKGTEKEFSGGDADTTNNRMEMMAIIQGLKALKGRCHVTIYTDSKYVMDGVTKYLAGWKARGWKTSTKKPVKNQDLWEMLEPLLVAHDLTWQWVKGHDGHIENERVDELARMAVPRG